MIGFKLYSFGIAMLALALTCYVVAGRRHWAHQLGWDIYMAVGPDPAACEHCQCFDGEHHPCCPVNEEDWT